MDVFRDGRAALESGAYELVLGGPLVVSPLRGVRCLSDTRLVGSYVTDRNTLRVWNCDTETLGEELFAPTNEEVAADPFAGLSDVYAGGGEVAGFYKTFWSHSRGRVSEPWCPLATDDSIGAVCVQLQRGGFGLGVLTPGSNIPIVLSNAPPGFQATFRRGLLTFFEEVTRTVYQWSLSERVRRVVDVLPPWLRDTAECSGGYLLDWHNEVGGLVTWTGGALERGSVVARGAHLNAPRLVHKTDALHVLSCTGPGELPHEFQRRVLRFSSPGDWEPIDLSKPVHSAPPPIVIPTFQPTDQRIGIGIYDEPHGPDFAEIPEHENEVAVYFTVGADDIDSAAQLARDRRLVMDAYLDKRAYPPALVPSAPGVRMRALAQATPIENESPAAFRDRIRSVVKGLKDKGHEVDISAATYCGWNGTRYVLDEQQVLDCLRVSWDIAVEFKCGAIWCFIYTRDGGKDGLVRWPNLMTAVNRLRAASADWRVFPTIPVEPEDDDMIILDPSTFEPYWEFPDRVVVKAADGSGDYLSVSETAQVSWVTGKVNQGGKPNSLLANQSFFWKAGEAKALAPRKGIAFEMKVK